MTLALISRDAATHRQALAAFDSRFGRQAKVLFNMTFAGIERYVNSFEILDQYQRFEAYFRALEKATNKSVRISSVLGQIHFICILDTEWRQPFCREYATTFLLPLLQDMTEERCRLLVWKADGYWYVHDQIL